VLYNLEFYFLRFSLCESITLVYFVLTFFLLVTDCTAAIDAGRRLGVEPVVSAKEMADPDVDYLGVMAYVARLRAAAPVNASKLPHNSVQPSKLSPEPPPAAPPATVASHSPRSDTRLQEQPVRAPASPLIRRIHVQQPTSAGFVSRTVFNIVIVVNSTSLCRF